MCVQKVTFVCPNQQRLVATRPMIEGNNKRAEIVDTRAEKQINVQFIGNKIVADCGPPAIARLVDTNNID